jgi:hypothetical protein
MSRPEAKNYQNKVRFGGTPKVRAGLASHPRRARYPEKKESKSERNWTIALLLHACFGPRSGADKMLRFAPDAGQIAVSKLAERFLSQLTIIA